MDFQDSWWNISLSSLLILTAPDFETPCGKIDRDKQTNSAENRTVRIPSEWVTIYPTACRLTRTVASYGYQPSHYIR